MCQLVTKWDLSDIPSVKVKVNQGSKLCDTGLLSTNVSGTSQVLLQPVGDEVCISQAIWSLLLCLSVIQQCVVIVISGWTS